MCWNWDAACDAGSAGKVGFTKQLLVPVEIADGSHMRKDFFMKNSGGLEVVARFCIGLDFVAGFWIEKVLF